MALWASSDREMFNQIPELKNMCFTRKKAKYKLACKNYNYHMENYKLEKKNNEGISFEPHYAS